MRKNTRTRFQEAARVALAELDDPSLNGLALTIELAVKYEREMGYSAAEEIQSERELTLPKPRQPLTGGAVPAAPFTSD